MAHRKNDIPNDLFEDTALDPMAAATGFQPRPETTKKRKAGFYISAALLDRFERKFYELKLSGTPVANKSALLEAALHFALEDMDMGCQSRLLSDLK